MNVAAFFFIYFFINRMTTVKRNLATWENFRELAKWDKTNHFSKNSRSVSNHMWPKSTYWTDKLPQAASYISNCWDHLCLFTFLMVSCISSRFHWHISLPDRSLDKPSHAMVFFIFTPFYIVDTYWRHQIYEQDYMKLCIKKKKTLNAFHERWLLWRT